MIFDYATPKTLKLDMTEYAKRKILEEFKKTTVINE
jgi:hypothetical protein